MQEKKAGRDIVRRMREGSGFCCAKKETAVTETVYHLHIIKRYKWNRAFAAGKGMICRCFAFRAKAAEQIGRISV